MPLSTTAAVADMDQVLSEVQALRKPDDIYRNKLVIPQLSGGRAVSLLRSAIERYTPADSAYRLQVKELTKGRLAALPHTAENLIGVLKALKSDYEAGRLNTIEQLIHADVSGDFLQQAETLAKTGYTAAAMVVAGSTLEQHLRLLAEAANITIYSGGKWKKADVVNADLVKNGVYGKQQQKTVTSLLGLRNSAAHGNTDDYSAEEVRLGLQQITMLVQQYPA
jgi:hypothetical protein